MANKGYEFDHLFMTVVIGDTSVGKSSLLRKLVSPDTQIASEQHIATIGVDFLVKSLQVRGQKIKLQVWDTAGQERFRSVTSTYFRGAMGALICYDCMTR